jgi:hypothetical protein
MNTLIGTAITGLGATALMDLWGLARHLLFGGIAPDYTFVGRWLGHMAHGQFVHHAIRTAPRVPRESAIGWTAHYVIGVAYAGLLVAGAGRSWLEQPMLVPALLVGIATVAAPFLLMQPCMGAGIAASRTPNPLTARMQSLVNHMVFGAGLYITGWIVARVTA